jgi:DNA-directed RNA polymerase specialized sigma24 family protein
MRRHLTARAAWNDEVLEGLVDEVLGGDDRAWHALWLVLDPEIERIAGRRRVLGPICERYDDRRDVVVRIMGALRANGGEILGKLHERLKARDGSSRRWFSGLVRHQAIDYARTHAENLEGVGASRWVEHEAIPEELPASERDPREAAEARDLLARVPSHVDDTERRALAMWLEGEKDAAIAEALGLRSAQDAARMLHAVRERLRAHLAPFAMM